MINHYLKNNNNYKLIKSFPESGQKWVYLLEDDDGTRYILKIVKKMDDRIQREIDLLLNLDVVGIPKLIDVSEIEVDDKTYKCIREQYIKGRTLQDVIKKSKLSLKDAVTLLDDILKIIVELEQAGVVHRDIKPGNIIYCEDGHFYLIDFGIARNLNLTSLTFTDEGVGPHTPGYGAPELFQYEKKNIDSRADLFSLGVVAYQCIYGRHPFIDGNEDNFVEIWYKTLSGVPGDINIPGDTDGQLKGFVQTLIKRQVIERPISAKKAYEWFLSVVETLDF